MPDSQLQQVMTREYGTSDWEKKHFAEFDHIPIAAAVSEDVEVLFFFTSEKRQFMVDHFIFILKYLSILFHPSRPMNSPLAKFIEHDSRTTIQFFRLHHLIHHHRPLLLHILANGSP